MNKPSHKPNKKQVSTSSALTGRVIAAHGRHYVVVHENIKFHCVTRGKKSDVAVGDMAYFHITAQNQGGMHQGVIESLAERKALLYRSDQYKSKMLAANVDQILIVVATEPSFSDDLISRALIAAKAAGIEAHIILNKIDVVSDLAKARTRLSLYQKIGYAVHEISVTAQAQTSLEKIQNLIQGKCTILIGQSGMGKSSLINLIVPDADITTREISSALDTGKHTTTFTRLYEVPHLAETQIIDSPGFQEFGLHHLSEGMLERAFVEFAPYLGHCKFYNCHHKSEPQCAVLTALAQGNISDMRHRLYLQLVHESEQTLGY